MVRVMDFKRVLLAAALLILPFAAHAGPKPLTAFAYDPPDASQGLYVGVNGGYGWGSSNQHDMPIPPVIILGDGHYDPSGGFIGGTLGYSRRLSNWLFGVEGDFAWADIHGSSAACGSGNECGTRLRSFGTLRGRFGPLFGATLLYATAGAALGDIHAFDTSETSANGTKWRTGWTVGGGIEQKLTDHWSAKLEYLYIDFGTTDYFTISNHTPEEISLTANVIRAGIDYRF
jgi:outer membrane immunogenic protein